MDPLDPSDSRPPADTSQPLGAPFEADFAEPNPYGTPVPLVVGSETPPPSRPSGPRWWTPLAISGLSLASFLTASVVMALVAVVVVHGHLSIDILRDPVKLAEVSRSRLGLLLLVVLPQFVLVIPALAAALLSPVPTRQRLGLVRGHWPLWAWLAAALATPLVGLISSLTVGMFMEESENLKEMTKIFREHGANGFLIPLALMIGATPAICEELLFRGYVQTRLTRSFGPLVGILVASFLFAAFHMDLVHVIAVFPMGLFLGCVSWRSGSLIPAMLGHFLNNVISVLAVVMAPEMNPDVLGLPALAITLTILASGIVGMAAVGVAAVVYGRPADDESADEIAPPGATQLA